MGNQGLVLGQTGLNLLVSCALFSGLSCGGDTTEPSTTGTLRITVTTSGPIPDADGYIFSIGGIGLYTLQSNGTIDITDLPPGSLTVQLIGLAHHCVVEDGDRRILDVPVGVVTPVAFTVSCVTQLNIQTTSLGPGNPDPDGYTVRIDDADWPVSISPNSTATLTVPGLALGVHSVFLGGLASNCQLQAWDGPPQNPQYVTIDADHPIVAANFMVWCSRSEPY
jgi:hypothetical protein